MKKIIALTFCLVVCFATMNFERTEAAVNSFFGVVGFKTDLTTAFTNNFTAAQRNAVANSFVSAYQGQFRAENVANTTGGRGAFAMNKIVDYIQDIHKAEQFKNAQNAVPTPTPLPDN